MNIRRRLAKLEGDRPKKPFGPTFLIKSLEDEGPTAAATTNGVIHRGESESVEDFEERVRAANNPWKSMEDMTDEQLEECLAALQVSINLGLEHFARCDAEIERIFGPDADPEERNMLFDHLKDFGGQFSETNVDGDWFANASGIQIIAVGVHRGKNSPGCLTGKIRALSEGSAPTARLATEVAETCL